MFYLVVSLKYTFLSVISLASAISGGAEPKALVSILATVVGAFAPLVVYYPPLVLVIRPPIGLILVGFSVPIRNVESRKLFVVRPTVRPMLGTLFFSLLGVKSA